MIAALLIAFSYRAEFFTRERLEKAAMPTHYHGPLMAKTIVVMAVMVALFFLGQPAAKVAIVGGAFLLLTRRVKPEKIYLEIDWPLLVMFVGLFVVVAGFEKTVLTPEVTAAAARLRLDDPGCSPASQRCCRTWSATCRRFCCSSRSCPICPIRIAPGW